MPLLGLVASVAIEVGPLLLESSLANMGRVASTISKSLEDSLPLKDLWAPLKALWFQEPLPWMCLFLFLWPWLILLP